MHIRGGFFYFLYVFFQSEKWHQTLLAIMFCEFNRFLGAEVFRLFTKL